MLADASQRACFSRMLILLLNIRHGGGRRAQALLDWIISKSPDVVVLTEWRDNAAGELLLFGLRATGFNTATAVLSGPRCNGIVLGTTDKLKTRRITPLGSKKGELLLAEMTPSWKVLAAYFPLGKAKKPFFGACIAEARSERAPLLVIGDLNTGNNNADVERNGAQFSCAECFDALQVDAPLFDLWRIEHGIRQEWSWRSTKNGFRIDHAFANAAFLDRFAPINCYYDHAPRELGLTDHSALLVNCSR